MSDPKIFLTGASGFIGGDILYTLTQAHPSWSISCLVRTPETGAAVSAAYPGVRLVYGSNASSDLLAAEAAATDIVIHAGASDEDAPGTSAIVRGLSQRSRSPSLARPCYIHTSGCLILAQESLATGRFGERFEHVFEDGDARVAELTVDAGADWPHRRVDMLAQDAAAHARVALVVPSIVYGKGRGPCKTRSWDVETWRVMRHRGKAFRIGRGENVWHTVHVRDLSRLYLLLVEAAVEEGLGGTGGAKGDVKGVKATWGARDGYYIAENGPMVIGDMLAKAARVGKDNGLLDTAELDTLTKEQADEVMPFSAFVLGTNARGVGRRARELLGWNPDGLSFEEEILSCMQEAEP